MIIQAYKAHGAGNDFILIPDLQDQVELTEENTAAMCHRNFGIGGDGAIRMGAPTSANGDVFMDYRNADGSLAEMCGNGVRTVAAWLHRQHPERDEFVVDTRAGSKAVTVQTNLDGSFKGCSVHMGVPTIVEEEKVVTFENGHFITGMYITIGNPHFVITVPSITNPKIEETAKLIQQHPDFPEGVNVEFISKRDEQTIEGRIIERGVGETLASGTGSTAMATCAIAKGWVQDQVAIHLPGGIIHAFWPEKTSELVITGPAKIVATMSLDLEAMYRP